MVFMRSIEAFKRLAVYFGCALSVLMVPLELHAAPSRVKAEYDVMRKGQLFARVTETFTQENGQYRIESITKGVGVYALLGVRKLVSEGEVTPSGLKPRLFTLQQGDQPRKQIKAEFDWAAMQLTIQAKGKVSTKPLENGVQDLASFAYQWMFVPPEPAFRVRLTTGKKLRNYDYTLQESKPLMTPAGEFSTVHLLPAIVGNEAVREDGAETNPVSSEVGKQLWLAKEQHYLVVMLTMQDEEGHLIEQRLTKLNVD